MRLFSFAMHASCFKMGFVGLNSSHRPNTDSPVRMKRWLQHDPRAAPTARGGKILKDSPCALANAKMRQVRRVLLRRTFQPLPKNVEQG